jgi:hypothetical protein
VTDEERILPRAEISELLNSRAQVMARFLERLDRAQELWSAGYSLDGSGTALAAVINLVTEMHGIATEHLAPLTGLLGTIRDLRMGRLPEGVLLAANRPPDAAHRVVARAQVAAVQQFLMTHGFSRKDASVYVIRHVDPNALGLGRRPVMKTVDRWRREFTGDGPELGRSVFKACLETLERDPSKGTLRVMLRKNIIVPKKPGTF